MRILPVFNEYFKTNYFTSILISLLALCVLYKFLPWVSSRPRKPRGAYKKTKLAMFLILACLLGGVLRAGWISICHYVPAFHWSDAELKGKNLIEPDGINIHAARLREGAWMLDPQGHPTTRRPIGYPDLLGALYAVFGATLSVFYVFNFALFFSTVILIYFLGKDLFGGEAGLLSAFLFSIYPVSIYSSCLALDEHLFLPLWYFGLLLLFRQIQGRPVRWALFWYGVIFGYATMTRTHTFFMPLVVGFVYFLAKNSWKKILLSIITVYVIAQIMILPWVIRNYRIWGVYVPYTATNHDVYHGCNPSVRSGDNNGHWPAPGEPGYNAELSQAISEYDVPKIQKLASQEIWSYMTTQPLDFVVLGVEKWLHFMGTTRKTGVWAIDLMEESKQKTPELLLSPASRHFFEECAFGAYYVLFYLFIFGLLRVARSWSSMPLANRGCFAIVSLCFLLYLGEHFILYPERKYRFPLEPFMIIVAASFLVWLVRDFSFPRRRHAS